MPKFRLWYPLGAGGMWLNYLLWCSREKAVIPGDHLNFEFPYLESLEPDYYSLVDFPLHLKYDSSYEIRLGSNHAWLNFFTNIVNKKGPAPDWRRRPPELYFNWQDLPVQFNLDWCDIFENPKQFLSSLSSITNIDIRLDPYTTVVFEQYYKSCAEPSIEIIQGWQDYIYSYRTSPLDPPNVRKQHADRIFSETYYPMKKITPTL